MAQLRQAFAKYWQKEELPFAGLSDPSHSVLKLYGQEVKLFKLGRMPAQVLIDKAGVARRRDRPRVRRSRLAGLSPRSPGATTEAATDVQGFNGSGFKRGGR